MLLTRENWDRFAAGRFEEFLDRAQDHLMQLYDGRLLAPKAVTTALLRQALLRGQALSKRLGRPTERMVVMLTKCFVVLGADFPADPRFSSLRDQIKAIAEGAPVQEDPVDLYLSSFEPISVGRSARFKESELEDFAKKVERNGGTELLEALSDTSRSMGLFDREMLRPVLRSGFEAATAMQIEDARLKILMALLAFRHGPALMRDPFMQHLTDISNLNGTTDKEAVLSTYLHTIVEVPHD